MNVFFPVSLNLTGRRCVVIGDDREAIEKEAALREAGADVHWIRNSAELRDEDIAESFFVISTPQDGVLSARLASLAVQHRVLLCCIDQPAYNSVAMAAIAKAGPVRIAISTTGQAPRVGKILKEALQRMMDGRFARFVDCQSVNKSRNRKRYTDSGAKRREAMIELARGFEVEITVRYPSWFEEAQSKCHPELLEGPNAGS